MDKKASVEKVKAQLDEHVADGLVSLTGAGDTVSDVVRRLVEKASEESVT